jgi:hypothetical protein
MDRAIYIYHKDWSGECILINNEIIIRKDKNNEKGNYKIIYNKLIIQWDKWGEDIFYTYDNNCFYNKDDYNKKYDVIQLIYKDIIQSIILDKEKLVFKNLDKNIEEKFIFKNNFIILIVNNKKITYRKLNNFLYVFNEKYNQYFFELNLLFENKMHKYLFNKIKNTFINCENINDYGTYNIEYNNIIMKWNDNIIKTFYSNNYVLEEKNYLENLKIIKPNRIIHDNKLLFSNISLCKNKIILTSTCYLYTPLNFDNLKINIKNNKIIKKNIYNYENYESSLSVIIELEYNNTKENIEINYDDQIYEIEIEQLNLKEDEIYISTLFKDDYELLNQYLKYYSNLGINNFFLYYNDIINDDFVEEINNINKGKYNIYLIEWNYIYWWVHTNNPKHHHAQTMAINDSLNILKNYCSYILYNDLDEYIKMENNFNELIKQYQNVDIFIFKCIFCKMGENKLKYEDFENNYDEKKIIFGNYWDKFREKNLIKCKKVNVMGVHNYVEKFNDDKLTLWDNGIFYHYINFEEKYRPELMHQYIS